MLFPWDDEATGCTAAAAVRGTVTFVGNLMSKGRASRLRAVPRGGARTQQRHKQTGLAPVPKVRTDPLGRAILPL
jgi:hypothetical protein